MNEADYGVRGGAAPLGVAAGTYGSPPHRTGRGGRSILSSRSPGQRCHSTEAINRNIPRVRARHMDREQFREAVAECPGPTHCGHRGTAVKASCRRSLDRLGCSVRPVDRFVPQQKNLNERERHH
jgi:hypothetical protein